MGDVLTDDVATGSTRWHARAEGRLVRWTRHCGTAAPLAALALLTSCSPLRDAVLRQQRALELAPDAPIHVVLTANRAAIEQADAGVLFQSIVGVPVGDGRLELVADDPGLDELVVTEARSNGTGGTNADAWIAGGDLRALCPGTSSCEIGVTLVLVAGAPANVSINFGVARDGDRGVFGVRGPAAFEPNAMVSMRIE